MWAGAVTVTRRGFSSEKQTKIRYCTVLADSRCFSAGGEERVAVSGDREQAVPLHRGKLAAERTPVHIQVVREFRLVEGEIYGLRDSG